MPNHTSNALYSVAEIRTIEQTALAAQPAGGLMQRAAQAAAALAQTLIAEHNAPILILAGPGNNGGDALEVAVLLVAAGLQPHVLHHAGSPPSPDCAAAQLHASQAGVHLYTFSELPALRETGWGLVIDGLFGIGLTRPLSGELRTALCYVNTLACPRLALDVPSGLNADTGNVVGPDGIALHATHTVTFIGDKPGLHTADGRDVAGQVQVDDLALDPALFPAASAHLNGPAHFARWLRARRQNSHKGSYGDLMVIGGAHGMSGAPVLSARAALQCGAGRVFIGFQEQAVAFDDAHPELMCRHAADLDFSSATLVVGPGLGDSRDAHDLLARALATTSPLVLDADALNLLAVEPGLQQRLQQRQGPTLLTPHPLEAARLLSTSTASIQADRLTAARKLARQFNATVVLKGSGTVIAQADGQVAINPTGNPALATAGTGDVLAGVCGALLAQGWPASEAALAAVWLHGRAADQLVEQGLGPIGLTASELIPAIRRALNQSINQNK